MYIILYYTVLYLFIDEINSASYCFSIIQEGSDRKWTAYRLLCFYYVGGSDRITLSMQHRNNVLWFFLSCNGFQESKAPHFAAFA